MEISLRLKTGKEIRLKAIYSIDNPEESNIYRLVSPTGEVYMKLELKDAGFEIIEKDLDIEEDESDLKEKLEELLVIMNPQQSSIGTEDNEMDNDEDDNSANPYDPETIRVDTKSFSLRQVYDMIKISDIDLSPDFQRNLVWDNLRKSRLIESILLRIPLPMFYFAQDEEGRISVVDGLQRLSTIRDFMDNKFALNGLEYLQAKCGGKYFNLEDKTKSIDAKYFRWFNMTQITVNVIDPSSPFKLKYDIFRRINTGGQPLNAQEIRNCLATNKLRSVLRQMSQLDSFKEATGWSVKDVRMEAQELALRFIMFHRKYSTDKTLNNYSGNIEYELNTLTETLNKDKNYDFANYVSLFNTAMVNAHHLFGNYSFRKCSVEHLQPGARRQLINKALFVSWAVLLSQFNEFDVAISNDKDSFAFPLAQRISEDFDLLMYLTYSTNSKANIQASFNAANEIINNHLKI
ncbi:MAG: DUF262 domain-containing protein [Paludibacter sp.]|nr:DUF262 domain-containing protein [Paludibacter sp.]